MELTSEHLSRLDEMVTLLSISDDLTIAFVRCNEPILRDALYAEIKDRVANEIFIYDIEMDRNSTNLLQLLNDAVDSDIYNSKIEGNKKIAFFISGLNEAIEKKTDEGRSEALALINMMRENFLNIGHTIIIWINTASLSMILKEAQDFFSWRTTVFEFGMEHREQISPVFEIGDTDLVFLNKDELEERWYNYSRLLREYQEKGIEDPYKFADWNYNLGVIKILMGHPVESMNYFGKSLGFSEKTGTKTGIANSLGRLGNAYRDLGQTKKAIEYYTQAIEIKREFGDRRGEGNNLVNIGLAYHDWGQIEKAIRYYKQALEISNDMGDWRGEGHHLGSLGTAYHDLGQTEKAIRYYKQALEISNNMGDRRGKGTHLGNLGAAYHDLGQTEKAIRYYKQALEISNNMGDRRGEGTHLGNLGNAYRDLGQTEKAIEYYEHALEISKDTRDRRGEGHYLGNLGTAYHDLGQTEKAIEYCEKSLAIGNEIKDLQLISFCEKNLNSMKKSQLIQSEPK